jgi:hypothetical protein
VPGFISWVETHLADIDAKNVEKLAPVLLTALIHAKLYTANIKEKLMALKAEAKGKIKFDILGCVEQFDKDEFTLIEPTEEKDDEKVEEDLSESKEQVDEKKAEVVSVSLEDIEAIDKNDLIRRPQPREKDSKKDSKKEADGKKSVRFSTTKPTAAPAPVYTNMFSALEDEEDKENTDDKEDVEDKDADDEEDETDVVPPIRQGITHEQMAENVETHRAYLTAVKSSEPDDNEDFD